MTNKNRTILQSEACHIEDCIAIADEYHRQKLGLVDFGDKCIFVLPEDAPRIDEIRRETGIEKLAIVDTRPEVVLDYLIKWKSGKWEFERLVLVLSTRTVLPILRSAVNAAHGPNFSIEKMWVRDDVSVIQVVSKEIQQSMGQGLLAGYALGRAEAVRLGAVDADTKNEEALLDLQQKYLSLLQLIALTPPTLEEEAVELRSKVAEQEEKLGELHGSLDELQGQLELTKKTELQLKQLQARYEALASSKLGKMQLSYWRFRKGKSE